MYENLASCMSLLHVSIAKIINALLKKIGVTLWSRLEYDAILFSSLSPERILATVRNIFFQPHTMRLTMTVSPDSSFQPTRNILSRQSGQITWFVTLTVIRARPPSIPCDASYPSGATFPPRWAFPSCEANSFADFSWQLLKCTHFADRVTVVLRHNHARNRVKNDTRYVSPHLKL